MSSVETLSAKQKHLIGIGAAISAGCEPCTRSFVVAAREAGACERGVRFAIESGLEARTSATTVMTAFADSTFARPELDAAFRQERSLLDGLIGVAAAIASNAAPVIESRVAGARALGATHEQLRLAAQIGRTAKRGAESEVEAAFAALLDGRSDMSRCCAGGDSTCERDPASTSAAGASPCGCGVSDASSAPTRADPCGCGADAEAGFETVRIEKTKSSCSLCEDYAHKNAKKSIVVMSCEGACLRGEISRQAANHLCHELAKEKTVRLCLGGAFTKDAGQRGLVRNAARVVALEGCSTRCASRMMRGHFPDLKPEVFVTDGMCDFDRSRFGIEELPSDVVRSLGRSVATKVAERL